MKSVMEWMEEFNKEKPGWNVRILRWFILYSGLCFPCVVLVWVAYIIVGALVS